MITSVVRERSGTKVMPVSANMRPASRFTREPNPLASLNGLNGFGGMRGLGGLGGLGATLLTRPGPNGGTEIVDSSGNTVYSESDVAANPSLLSSLPSPCPGRELPTYFPGGESICADNNTRIPGEGTVAYAQFNYPINGYCPVAGWCMQGSDPNSPSSYVWQGGGSPTSLNPAVIMSAQPLPQVYNQPSGTPPAQTVTLAPPPPKPVTPDPNVSNVIKPPTGNTGVTPQSIANASPQTGNTNVSVGTNSPTIADQITALEQQAESASGLSGMQLLLIGAGLVAFMVFKK